jgi:hypothetical protein
MVAGLPGFADTKNLATGPPASLKWQPALHRPACDRANKKAQQGLFA